MCSPLVSVRAVLSLALASLAAFGMAQQIQVTSPFVGARDSYFERTGVSWGGRFGSAPGGGTGSYGFFNFGQVSGGGAVGGVIPPFGGYDPNSGARFGFGQFQPNGTGFSFNLEMAKGSSRSIVSSAPSLVVQNGFGGSIMSGGVRPFVTGLIPVVGGQYPYEPDNGVTRALASGQLNLAGLGRDAMTAPARSEASRGGGDGSTAGRPAASVFAIRARREAEANALRDRVGALLAEADQALRENQPGQARLRLKRARAIARDEAQLREIARRLAALDQ